MSAPAVAVKPDLCDPSEVPPSAFGCVLCDESYRDCACFDDPHARAMLTLSLMRGEAMMEAANDAAEVTL